MGNNTSNNKKDGLGEFKIGNNRITLLIKFQKKYLDPIFSIVASLVTLSLSFKIANPSDIADKFLEYFHYIGSTFNIWGTIFISFIFIVLLYLFRQTFRLAYGLLEFSFGFGCIILPMFENNFDYSSIEFGYSIIMRLIAGAYVTVRGIDNICKGLKERQWLSMVVKFLKYD